MFQKTSTIWVLCTVAWLAVCYSASAESEFDTDLFNDIPSLDDDFEMMRNLLQATTGDYRTAIIHASGQYAHFHTGHPVQLHHAAVGSSFAVHYPAMIICKAAVIVFVRCSGPACRLHSCTTSSQCDVRDCWGGDILDSPLLHVNIMQNQLVDMATVVATGATAVATGATGAMELAPRV